MSDEEVIERFNPFQDVIDGHYDDAPRLAAGWLAICSVLDVRPDRWVRLDRIQEVVQTEAELSPITIRNLINRAVKTQVIEKREKHCKRGQPPHYRWMPAP